MRLSIVSILTGLVSLALGLGATLALLSCLAEMPIGPEFLFEHVTAKSANPGPDEIRGATSHIDKLIPSMSLVAVLLVGASAGGLGVTLAQMREDGGNALTAKLGVLSNVVGILVWWIGLLLVDWTQYR
jgi:hypothetical protein